MMFKLTEQSSLVYLWLACATWLLSDCHYIVNVNDLHCHCYRCRYAAMSSCWLADPCERPLIADLQTCLHNFCSSIARLQ